MVVGSECSITVNADVTLGVLNSQRAIIIDAENLQQQKEQRRILVFVTAVNVGNSHTHARQAI